MRSYKKRRNLIQASSLEQTFQTLCRTHGVLMAWTSPVPASFSRRSSSVLIHGKAWQRSENVLGCCGKSMQAAKVKLDSLDCVHMRHEPATPGPRYKQCVQAAKRTSHPPPIVPVRKAGILTCCPRHWFHAAATSTNGGPSCGYGLLEISERIFFSRHGGPPMIFVFIFELRLQNTSSSLALKEGRFTVSCDHCHTIRRSRLKSKQPSRIL